MDEKTKVLISLGAATAANCVPCFEHYFGKANALAVSATEIQEAVELASQVKKGAHMAMRGSVSDIMGRGKKYDLPCSRQSEGSCCG